MEMIGTEKQITWANDIKTRVEQWIARAKIEHLGEMDAEIDALFAPQMAETDASAWIGNLKSLPEIDEDLQTFTKEDPFSGKKVKIKRNEWIERFYWLFKGVENPERFETDKKNREIFPA